MLKSLTFLFSDYYEQLGKTTFTKSTEYQEVLSEQSDSKPSCHRALCNNLSRDHWLLWVWREMIIYAVQNKEL